MGLKASDLRNMTEDEIRLKIDALREEIFKLTNEAKMGRAENPHRLKGTRRDIARCRTVLKEKKIEKAQ